MYNAVKEVFASSFTKSLKLDDTAGLQQTLGKLTTESRLPTSNSRESIEVIRVAWDEVCCVVTAIFELLAMQVDIFNRESTQNKLVTKVSYFIMLFVGVMTTILTVTSCNQPDVVPSDKLDGCVIGLTLTGTLVASLIAFLDPSTKWQQLRGSSPMVVVQ